MNDRFPKTVVRECLQRGCSEAEASLQTGFTIRVGLELENVVREYIRHTHFGVRVSWEGRIGLANTSAVENLSADMVSEMAVRSAMANPVRHGLPRICPIETLPQDDVQIEHVDVSLDEWVAWIDTEAESIRQTFRCQLLSLMFGYEVRETVLHNSNKATGQYAMATSLVAGVAQSNLANQPRPTFFLCHGIVPGDDIAATLSSDHFPECLSYSSANSIEELKGRIKFSQMASAQLISSIAQAFKGDNILHRKSFLRRKHIGRQLWSKSVSLIDDPVAVGGKVRLPFDAEGILAERKYLVREGMVVGALCDIATQFKLGIGKPGNAYRVPPDHEIKIAPSNLIMEIHGCRVDNYDVYIRDLGVQSILEPVTGRLSGIATGYRVTSSGKKPALFRLDLDTSHLFVDVSPASNPVWTGSVYAPAFISMR